MGSTNPRAMDQPTNFTQLSIPLARSSPNYAPRQPIEDAIRNKKLNKSPSRFEQSVREWYRNKLNYEKATWNEIISMSQLVAMFRKGQQLLLRRPYGAPGYYVRPIQNDDTYRQTAMNIMTFHSQISESKLMAVNPTVNMRPGDDTPEAIAAAQACRPVVDYYESQWYTAKFTRREAIRLLTDGMFIHQVRWNPFKSDLSVPTQTVTRRNVVLDPGSGSCADCQYEGEAGDFAPTDYGNQCPQCQSGAVDVRPAVTDSLAQIGMGQPKPVGEPEIISSALASWRWDLAVDLEMSTWAIKRQCITQGVVNLMLGDINVPNSDSSDDYGLEILHALAYSGQAFQGASNTQRYGSGSESIDTKPTMAEAWLSPEDQAEIECDDGDTICGTPMKRGKLSDNFKGQSICLVGLNDMALIIGTYANETQKSEVVTGHWFMDAESGAGRGMEDTAGVQKRFNAVDGQIYQGLAATATPSVLTDMSIIKEDDGKYLFRPGVNIDVNLSLLPPNTKLADAFFLGNPGAVSPQYINYGTVFLKQMADLSSLAVEFSDLLSIDNRTATGSQISAALANSLYGPMLMSKAESRVEIAKKIVKLQAQYGVASRFFPGKGAARGRDVSVQSLKGRVIFELVENSHLPVTPYSQQTDVTNIVSAFGGALPLAQLKTMDGELFTALTKPFNLELGSETEDEISTLCLSRLEQMKQMFQAGQDDPDQLVQMIQPPVSVYEPKQKEKQQWWSSWLDLESAQKSPMPIRLAAEAMWNLHENLMTKGAMPQAVNQGLVAGMGSAAAAAPAALGAQALGIGQQSGAPDTSAQDNQHEAVQNDQDRELEAAQHLSDQDHEMRLKQLESATQVRVTQEQGKNAIDTAKIAGDNAVRTQRAKPKPKKSAA